MIIKNTRWFCALVMESIGSTKINIMSLDIQSEKTIGVTIPENNNDDIHIETNYPQDDSLDYHIKILFALNGATEALPGLALTSLINDRIEIPAQYLPAYYAIAFLPYSLKPFYAMITNLLVARSRSGIRMKRHVLLIILQILASIAICSTAFLPPQSTIACFIIAFIKGMAVAWAEFMVGLALITSARVKSRSRSITTLDRGNDNDENIPNNNSDDDDRDHIKQREEVALSLYQSEAATCRNSGSLIAQLSIFIFIYVRGGTGGESQQILSDDNVTFILLITGAMPLISAIVAFKGQAEIYICENSSDIPSFGNDVNAEESLQSNYHERRRRVSKNIYDQVSNIVSSNDSFDDDMDSQNHSSIVHIESKYVNTFKLEIASLVVFQLILVLIGMRTPIIAVTSINIWNVLLGALIFSLVILVLCSISFFSVSWFKWEKTFEPFVLSEDNSVPPCNRLQIDSNQRNDSFQTVLQDDDEHKHTERSIMSMAAKQLMHMKRVATYLILRHSIPSAGVLVSSFIYTVFREKPLYLQSMSLLSSTSAVISTYFYSRRISQEYASMKSIINVIIVATILTSLWSLLDIPFIRFFREAYLESGGDTSENDNDLDDDNSLFSNDYTFVIVLFSMLQLIGGFLGEVSFLPSVVLATNSIVSFDASSPVAIEDNASTHSLRTNSKREEQDEAAVTVGDHEKPWILDDGIQYGFMISCIDFGDQLADWISVPIIEVLGVRREDDQWTNLNWFIILCSVMGILSLGFLRLLTK